MRLMTCFFAVLLASCSADDTESIQAKIARAMAAGPPDIAKLARVVDNGKMVVLREGNNGFTCMPGNPKVIGDPAMCADAASMQCRQERHQGAEAVALDGNLAGALRQLAQVLARPAVTQVIAPTRVRSDVKRRRQADEGKRLCHMIRHRDQCIFRQSLYGTLLAGLRRRHSAGVSRLRQAGKLSTAFPYCEPRSGG
jgi:hypothetical protein